MEQYNQPTDLFLEDPVVYAGFWERFGAAFIDGLILGVIGLVLGLILDRPRDAYTDTSVYSLYFTTSNYIGIVINWLYYALQESGPSQATIGKRALGIKVTSVDGGRISFGQATGRYFAKILSTVILLIGYLMMLWDARKQTLHDKLAGTLVIKAKA